MAATAGIGLLLLLGATEVVLRASGHGPWRRSVREGEPVVYEPDPELGWRNKPGRHLVAPYAPGGSEIQLTFLPDGGRATRDAPAEDAPDGRPALVLLGGSFTQGWAVSDRETFAWKLQERHPELSVENLGTGGYGTFQSLLALERRLARGAAPAWVLYGFMNHHEYRNVANAYWLDLLARNASRGHVAVPYATLEEGALVRHPPAAYPSWPLRETLATSAFAGRLAMKAKTLGRRRQAREVTEALLLELARTAAAAGAEFRVVVLAADDATRDHYEAFARAHGVGVLDCARPLTPDLQVEGEGHPNGALHGLWADCIDAALRPALAGVGAADQPLGRLP